MFARWMSGVRVEPRALGAIAVGLLIYYAWVYNLAPTRFDAKSLELLDPRTIFDGRFDPWLVWVHNIYAIYSIPYACFILTDSREQTFPGWPFALAALTFLGVWPLFVWYAIRNDGARGPVTLGSRIAEGSFPVVYAWFWGAVLSYMAFAHGDLAVLARYLREDFYVHGCAIDLVLMWLFFPVALRLDMKKRGMTSRALFWAVCAPWLVGALVYLVIRKPLRA